MNKDKYGEIINGPETYIEISNKLKSGKSVIIGWTDEKYTHYDILFTGGAYKEIENYFQRGIKATDLFVSIMSRGAFGFEVSSGEKSVGYVAKKLNLGINETSEKFTELLNGVVEKLLERN